MKLQIPCSSYTWRFLWTFTHACDIVDSWWIPHSSYACVIFMPEVCYSDIWCLLWIFAHAWGMCDSGLITHSPYAWRLLSEPHIWCMLNSFTLSSFGWLLTPEILVDILWESQSYHPITYGQRKCKFCTYIQVVTGSSHAIYCWKKCILWSLFLTYAQDHASSAETSLVVVNLSVLR